MSHIEHFNLSPNPAGHPVAAICLELWCSPVYHLLGSHLLYLPQPSLPLLQLPLLSQPGLLQGLPASRGAIVLQGPGEYSYISITIGLISFSIVITTKPDIIRPKISSFKMTFITITNRLNKITITFIIIRIGNLYDDSYYFHSSKSINIISHSTYPWIVEFLMAPITEVVSLMLMDTLGRQLVPKQGQFLAVSSCSKLWWQYIHIIVVSWLVSCYMYSNKL